MSADIHDEICGYEDDGTPFTVFDVIARVAEMAKERGLQLAVGENSDGEATYALVDPSAPPWANPTTTERKGK